MIRTINILQIFADALTYQDYGSKAAQTGKGKATANSDIAQSTTSLPIEIKSFYVKVMLENLRAQLVHAQFAKKQALPEGNGHTAEWRKWDTFAADLTPLTEGITPDPQSLGVSHVLATVEQFGNWVPITDRVDWESCDDTILGATEELSAQAGQTADIYTRNKIIAGATSAGFAKGDGTAIPTSISALTAKSVLTSEDVNRAATILKANNVPKINGDYVCIIHPYVAMDLRNCKGWLAAHEYAQPEEIYNGEIGKLHGVRFIETSNAKVSAVKEYGSGKDNTVPVFDCLFFGKDAYGIVEPSGQSLEMIIKDKEQAGGPLNQRSTVGYKFSTAVAVLQPERIYNLRCTSTFDNAVASN